MVPAVAGICEFSIQAPLLLHLHVADLVLLLVLLLLLGGGPVREGWAAARGGPALCCTLGTLAGDSCKNRCSIA